MRLQLGASVEFDVQVRRPGFNIELKFDDNIMYHRKDLECALQAILQVWPLSLLHIELNAMSIDLLQSITLFTFISVPTDINKGVKSFWQVVFQYAKNRPVFFSSFHPDEARMMRELQSLYPVCFETYLCLYLNCLTGFLNL